MIQLIIVIAAGLGAGFLITGMGLALVRHYDRRYRAYADAARRFFAAANRLADNPQTPDDVLSMLGDLSGTINFPHTSLLYVRMLQNKARRKKAGEPIASSFNLLDMPQSVVPDFVIALTSWLDAVTYRSMVFGPILRSMLDAKTVSDTAAKAAGSISNSRHHAPAHA